MNGQERGTRKVLLINQYFVPDRSATAEVFRYLVDTLTGAGYEVTVVCGRPSYRPDERSPWRLWSRERLGPVTIQRVGSLSCDRSRIARRVANYVSFLLLAALRCLFLPRHDVVICGTDPPLAVVLAPLAARGRPIVYSVQDLHPDATVAARWLRESFLTRVWDRVHTKAMGRCDVVACIGARMADRVEAKGVEPARIRVIHNGWAAPLFEPSDDLVAELRGGADFVAIHAGNLGAAGPWTTIAEAARLTGDQAEIVFVGGGVGADELERRDVRVLPFRPGDQLGSVMAAGDLQIVAVRRGLDGLVLPSKIYSVMAHGRPVLAVVPSECDVASIVRDAECGLVADPDDPTDIAEKIEWAQGNSAALVEMGSNARHAARLYDRSRCFQAYVEIADQFLASRPTG